MPFIVGGKHVLRSCQYCGRVHDSKYDCGKRPTKIYKRNSAADRFRYTAVWQQKREEIKERDNYLCQICIRNLFNTKKILNSENISVHHAEKLEENFEKRLDNDNLLTLCEMHHKKADKSMIPFEVIKRIITEQNHPPECES